MTAETQDRRDRSFLTGLLMGTFVGAGLAACLVPKVASLRRRVTDSAKELGTRVGEAVDDLTKKGQSVRDDVADAVARGAHEVERIATAARTDRVAETGQHAAADRRTSTPH